MRKHVNACRLLVGSGHLEHGSTSIREAMLIQDAHLFIQDAHTRGSYERLIREAMLIQEAQY
jgi:hypothetical protein